ncbi:MAG: hypothetical protein IT285_03055 [Bdellovibrionales bacterium]|nr:hypothetical protein [Bdellovibrionales bacterium]
MSKQAPSKARGRLSARSSAPAPASRPAPAASGAFLAVSAGLGFLGAAVSSFYADPAGHLLICRLALAALAARVLLAAAIPGLRPRLASSAWLLAGAGLGTLVAHPAIWNWVFLAPAVVLAGVAAPFVARSPSGPDGNQLPFVPERAAGRVGALFVGAALLIGNANHLLDFSEAPLVRAEWLGVEPGGFGGHLIRLTPREPVDRFSPVWRARGLGALAELRPGAPVLVRQGAGLFGAAWLRELRPDAGRSAPSGS